MENKTLSSNKLLECCHPIFQFASVFYTDDRGENLELNYREKIVTAFDNLERDSFEQQIPLANMQQAKYALAAYIDELVLSSAWPGRTTWMGKPLQLQFFGEHLAGEGFFKRLSELRQNGAAAIDVLEVYYICLQFGFEGVYRMRGLEQVMALQVDLRNQIEMLRGIVDPRLSSENIPHLSMTAKLSEKIPFWVIASVTATILFFIYLGYAIAINYQADQVLTQIKISRDALIQEL